MESWRAAYITCQEENELWELDTRTTEVLGRIALGACLSLQECEADKMCLEDNPSSRIENVVEDKMLKGSCACSIPRSSQTRILGLLGVLIAVPVLRRDPWLRASKSLKKRY